MVGGQKEATLQKRIKDFPSDDQPWRIEWIGRISYSIDDEPKIRIHLSRLKQGIELNKALYNDSLFGSKDFGFAHKAVDIKIGFIQLLKIGSVWINGVEQLNYRGSEEMFDILLDSVVMLQLAKTGSIKTDRGWENILSNYQYRIADDLARQGSWVAVVRDHPKYKKIVIPSSVIFQSCYVTSPKAATKIVFGQLDKLIDPELSGYLVEEPNIFRLSIRANYKDAEGVLLANLATDPAAKENLKRLRQNIVIQNNRVTPEQTLPLRVNFPFSNLMHIKVVGKTIHYESTGANNAKKTELGFFVSEIRLLRTDFQFESILPVRKNDGTKGNTKAEELAYAYGGAKQTELGEENQVLLTNNDVSDFIEATQINTPPEVDISHVNVIKNVKEYQTHQNKPFSSMGKFSEEDNGQGTSTGDGRQIKGGASKANVFLAPVELDSFFKVIADLNSKGLNIECLSICNSARADKGIVNYFPKKIKGCYSWHLTEDEKRARAFIMAKLYRGGVWHYLIDVEAKSKNGMSIAHVQAVNGQEIPKRDLFILMKRVANANGWSALNKNEYYAKSWRFQAIDHSRKGDYRKVADNIVRALQA